MQCLCCSHQCNNCVTMSPEPKNQQQLTVPLTDEVSFGADMACSYMDDDPSDDVRNSRGELTYNTGEDASIQLAHEGTSYSGTRDNSDLSTLTGGLQAAIDEYIARRRQYCEKVLGRELTENGENNIRQQLAIWNTFLQLKQGVQGTSAIISSDIEEDIDKFMEFSLSNGEQRTANYKKTAIKLLQEWNKFLQTRAGETLVTSCGMSFTAIGLFLFLLDLVSDIGTAIYYAYMGQWWKAIVTFLIVYANIVIHTVMKWLNNEIHFTGTPDWLRFISSLLVNWPDVKQYGVLCRLEWKLYKSPETNAHLVPEWHRRRLRVAYMKYTEGVCEACPQAILQLCLLLPDLYGDLTWTDYLRIGSVCISLCTAGAALTNSRKITIIARYIDVPMCELVVLHVWAVPVTVSRLLSVALLLTVEPYWGLAGVALHCVLYGVYMCRTDGVPCALNDILNICLNSLFSFISPFNVAGSINNRRVRHVIHLLGNTVATVVWALGTPLVCSHPALYTAIICLNAVMYVLGLVGWALHEKYWPHSYFECDY